MRDEWAVNFRLLTCWLNWEFKIEPCWSELCCAEDWWEVTGHSPVPPWPAGSSTCSEFSLLLHPTTAATGWKPQADFQPAQNTRYPPPLQWSPTPHGNCAYRQVDYWMNARGVRESTRRFDQTEECGACLGEAEQRPQCVDVQLLNRIITVHWSKV